MAIIFPRYPKPATTRTWTPHREAKGGRLRVRARKSTHQAGTPPSLVSYGSKVVQQIIALKTLQGKISADTFWKRYFRLRGAFYSSHEWKALRPSGKKQCSRNLSHKGKLDRHHKHTIFDRPDLALDPTNLEWLCRRCHNKEH